MIRSIIRIPHKAPHVRSRLLDDFGPELEGELVIECNAWLYFFCDAIGRSSEAQHSSHAWAGCRHPRLVRTLLVHAHAAAGLTNVGQSDLPTHAEVSPHYSDCHITAGRYTVNAKADGVNLHCYRRKECAAAARQSLDRPASSRCSVSNRRRREVQSVKQTFNHIQGTLCSCCTSPDEGNSTTSWM